MTNPTPSPDHVEMAELLPCPFCGDSVTVQAVGVISDSTPGKWGAVHCCCVGPEVRTNYEPVEVWRDRAIAEWNKRAPSESSPAGCERCGETEELLVGVGDAQHAALTKVSELRQQLAAAERTIAELESQLQRMRWMAFDGDNTITELRTRAESAELTNQQLAEKCLKLVAENDLLRARTADGVETGAAKLGRKLFEFTSFMDWVNHAKARFEKHCGGMCSTDYVCVDAAGFICARGGQFMRARDQERYPVSVYSIEPDSNPTPKST